MFLTYNRAIASESDTSYSAASFHNRIRIMEGFQARERIFMTLDMASTHEAQARRNIARQLQYLHTAVSSVPAFAAMSKSAATLTTQGH